MGSEGYPVQHKGIYHNLPTFDPSIKNLTAIVTGANGISGFHTMRVLLESPERWSKVYALSRRPPPKEMMGLLTEAQRSRVQHVAVDFLEDPKKIADAMTAANVTADYIFFYSYLQPRPPPGAMVWSNAEYVIPYLTPSTLVKCTLTLTSLQRTCQGEQCIARQLSQGPEPGQDYAKAISPSDRREELWRSHWEGTNASDRVRSTANSSGAKLLLPAREISL